MSLRRRAGAPRLIEWTGERCVPWTPDVQVVYEHVHRYLWAADLLHGGRVLDLASGEGFGASILADHASEVVGLELDERTVEHAQLSWSSERVSFQKGDARDLSRFEDGAFDAIVAFELIEHLNEQQQMLAEVARVLSPGGLLMISTPDRRIYSEATGETNPFHEHELSRDEFAALLAGEFSEVAIWGQRTITGSHVDLLEGSVSVSPAASEASYFIKRAGDEWRIAGEPAGRYMVALASNSPLPSVARHSTLSDCGLELLREAERRAAELTNAIMAERDRASSEANAATGVLSEQALVHEQTLKARNAEIAQRDAYVRHRDGEITEARAQTLARENELATVRQELAKSQLFTRQVEESITWQAFQRARGRLLGRLGESSRGVRSLQGMLRLAGRVMRSRASRVEVPPDAEVVQQAIGESIRLPTFERPTVSLIIPVYSGAELTRRCLESIRDYTDLIGYEVIIVDDASDQDTKDLLTLVEGAQLVVNQQNLGYLKSVNRGALAAKGEWLCLCNNDIEVTSLWLQSMVDCAESRDDVGIVVPKFVAPDGLLSEAGGIIWNDGTGVNYGRGARPDACHYNFAREVDYGSAAALLVRAQLWQEVGGFDPRFEPMYYEDVDLCFEARSRGWKVFYEPVSVVIHAEGSTAGTDLNVGHKRHQESNRARFVEKWGEHLASEHLQPGAQRVREAATRLRGSPVLVIDFRVPMRDRDAGSLRMYEILRALQRQGYGVTFVPDNFLPIEPYTRELQRLGVEVFYGELNLLTEFAAIGPRLRAAILSRPHSASRWLDSVREYAPSALVVYDTVDLHWVRESRRYVLSRDGLFAAATDRGVAGPKANALRELELALVRASDLTVTVTDDERAQILNEVPGASVAVIPTVHDVSSRVAPADQRDGLLFVGGFEHPPNADAAVYLVEEVMPQVWLVLPELMLTIVGSSAPSVVQELASSRVDVRGWVPDLEPLFENAEALVAPVRFGAGVKGKITQALAAGLPVVTSSIGAEGLGGLDGVNMLIGDNPEALAQRIIRLASDPELWSTLSAGGQLLITEKCSLEVLDERIRGMLSQAVGEHSGIAH